MIFNLSIKRAEDLLGLSGTTTQFIRRQTAIYPRPRILYDHVHQRSL